MPRRMPERSNDVTVYMVLNDYRTGLAYLETAADEADRETVIRNFLNGQYSNALRVIAFNTAERWSQDVSEDIVSELLERAFDGDDTLSEATKRFIDRHISPGEKRPPAPSMRRESGQDRRAHGPLPAGLPHGQASRRSPDDEAGLAELLASIVACLTFIFHWGR
jgi:hypothetical protein